MQIGKAGVVAVGALATVAALGTPSAAALSGVVDKTIPTTVLDMQKTQVKRTPVPAGPIQPLITIGVGSAVTAAPWQACASDAVWGVGGVAPVSTAHNVLGSCSNANVLLKQDQVPGLISILDDTSINALPWQACGSHIVGGVGVNVAVNTPNTVTGSCYNANTLIQAPDGPGPKSLISLGSGSVLNALAWQACGSSAVWGLGAVVAVNSPTTVLGDCADSHVTIQPRPNPALLPILSNQDLNILPLQTCGDDSGLIGLVGLVVPLNSPGFVGGTCTKGN